MKRDMTLPINDTGDVGNADKANKTHGKVANKVKRFTNLGEQSPPTCRTYKQR